MNTDNQTQPIYPNLIVDYTYTHKLNRKSSTQIVKRGIVIRAVREKSGMQRPTGFYMVKLNGNKGLSKIHYSNLLSLKTTDIKNLKNNHHG